MSGRCSVLRDRSGKAKLLQGNVARGPALINNRGVSKGLKREAPPEEGAL